MTKTILLEKCFLVSWTSVREPVKKQAYANRSGYGWLILQLANGFKHKIEPTKKS